MTKEKTTKVRPCGEYVLVLRMPNTHVSAGGIIIPDDAQAKADRGKVLAVGPGRITGHGVRIEPQVKRGDVVLLPKWAGAEDMRGSLAERHMLVKQSEILGVEVT